MPQDEYEQIDFQNCRFNVAAMAGDNPHISILITGDEKALSLLFNSEQANILAEAILDEIVILDQLTGTTPPKEPDHE